MTYLSSLFRSHRPKVFCHHGINICLLKHISVNWQTTVPLWSSLKSAKVYFVFIIFENVVWSLKPFPFLVVDVWCSVWVILTLTLTLIPCASRVKASLFPMDATCAGCNRADWDKTRKPSIAWVYVRHQHSVKCSNVSLYPLRVKCYS